MGRRRWVSWGVGACTLGLLLFGFGLWPWRWAAQGTWLGPDSYDVLDLLSAHGPLGFLARDGAPDGVWSHWSAPYLRTIQATAWVLRQLGWGPSDALGLGGAAWGVGSFVGLWALLGWSRRPGPGSWALGAVLLATSLPLEVYGRPDRITHHLFLLLLVAIGWGAIWRPRGGVWAGILLGVALWASPEMAPLMIGAVGMRLTLRTTLGAAYASTPMALGLCGSLLLAYGGDPPPPTFGPWALDHLSLSYLALALAVVLPLVGADRVRHVGYRAWIGFKALLVAVVAAWILCVPNARLGPEGLVPPDIRWMWWDRVVELQPLDSPVLLALGVLVPAAVLLAALWTGRRDPVALTWAGIVVISGGMAVLHERSTLPLAWLVAVWAAGSPIPRPTQIGLGALACTVWLVLSPTLRPQDPEDPCVLGPIQPVLERMGPMTVLAPLDQAPEILWRVPGIRTLAGPYHHNVEGMRDVLRAWGAVASSGDSAARSVVARRHVQALLVCPMVTPSLYGPRSLMVRLALGQVPDWLVRVPLPMNARWKLYRVRTPE